MNGWQMHEGRIDPTTEHFALTYEGEDSPVALIGRGKGKQLIVDYLIAPHEEQKLTSVRREIEYYLLEVGGPQPWRYAIYHCGTTANVYSKVHWNYFPAKSDMDGE